MFSLMLIGFAGPGGSGKTSAAALLQSVCGFRRVSFADPIKDAVCAGMGIDRADLERLKRDQGQEQSIRRWLRAIGDHGRSINSSAYTLLARRRWRTAMVASHDCVCVDDVRLESEAEAIRDDGGVIVHVTRPGIAPAGGHVTEIGVLVEPGDLVLDNSGSPQELRNRLLALLAEIRHGRAA